MMNPKAIALKKVIFRQNMATLLLAVALPVFWTSLAELPSPLAIIRVTMAVGAFGYLVFGRNKVNDKIAELVQSSS